MIRRVRSACVASILAATATMAFVEPAGADIVVPGRRNIGYGFSIENADAFPQCVFIAYPWSASNGTPTTEGTLVGQTMVSVGRRSPGVLVHAMSRANYDADKPPLQGDAAAAYFKNNPKVMPTGIAVQPEHSVATEAPYRAIHDSFVIEKCDATSVKAKAGHVTYTMSDGTTKRLSFLADGKRPPPDAKEPEPVAAPSASAPDVSPATISAPVTTPTRGCGSCAVGAAEKAPLALSLGFFAYAIAALRRRKR